MKKAMLLIIISLYLISCGRGANEESDEVSAATWDQGQELLPVAVEVLEVTKGRLIPYIEASGTIRGIREAWVISETQGPITDLKVSLGQKVKKGDILLTVENSLQKLNRDLAMQQYESTRLDFEALERSYKSGGLSRSDYNASRTRLLQAQAAYESSEKVYEDSMIKAPFDGSVALMDSALTVGGYISPGSRIALVIDTSSMKMDISLGERQINLIETGQKANVEILSQAGREPIEATVEAVSSGSESTTGSFPVLITWENRDNGSMRSGLSAKVLIENRNEAEEIVIPSSAIVVRDRKTSVILAEEGRTLIREVVPGRALGGHTIIESGLDIGDKLIVSALSSLGNGFVVETTIAGKTGDWR